MNSAEVTVTVADGGSGSATWSTGISNLLPGDYFFRWVDVTNTGSVPQTFAGSLSGTLTLPKDADGIPTAVLCISRDVTEEVSAEEALRLREAHHALLYEAAPIGIGRTTLDGRWLDANPRLCAMLGYAPGELIGRSGFDFDRTQYTFDYENFASAADGGASAGRLA